MTRLYGFGSNGSGQLGIGHLEDTKEPTLCIGLPNDSTIVKVAGGGNHSALITKHGKLFMAGLSQFGEEVQKTIPEYVQGNAEWTTYQLRFEHIQWKDIACGWACTLMLDTAGQLYGIGTSRWNELLGSSTDKLRRIEHDSLKNIVSVSCGWRHVVVLDKEGQVYGWGWGKKGQLGPLSSPSIVIDTKKDIRSVQKIDMPQTIVEIACGHVHTLLRGQDGTVYGLGSNKYSQLGEAIDDENDGSLSVVFKNAALVDACWHNSAILDSAGDIEILGRNDHGQLGTCQPPLKKIACGSEHVVAISKETEHALAWGWNEHGNCASDELFTSQPVYLDQFGKVDVIGAGCATSWFGTNTAYDRSTS
ncbi:regulator of chromosome condensation 1/beta-lactamase-inhibitor protein II [Mycotypha africana]|uniref:regulator of chromosome condensation 1/beta-lactamase-inhibitor protein II n=1 Tax=Mycotypha africana TaxID=64632 RepID=UPI0023018170|nr:regulator of chromosome condensation 1/beta-lactamase-inhibitor protein II [Mycotypha africana]KAI8990766.1 regulator of chromosome condensation 1/beta-lactamase-inhibitor protein II [Mycotypha africana]